MLPGWPHAGLSQARAKRMLRVGPHLSTLSIRGDTMPSRASHSCLLHSSSTAWARKPSSDKSILTSYTHAWHGRRGKIAPREVSEGEVMDWIEGLKMSMMLT